MTDGVDSRFHNFDLLDLRRLDVQNVVDRSIRIYAKVPKASMTEFSAANCGACGISDVAPTTTHHLAAVSGSKILDGER